MGKAVAHVLLAIFTAGIGNVILEFAAWSATMIAGGIAMVKVVNNLIKILGDLTAGTDVEGNAVKLGSIVPKIVLAVLKFFGAGGRRLAMKSHLNS